MIMAIMRIHCLIICIYLCINRSNAAIELKCVPPTTSMVTLLNRANEVHEPYIHSHINISEISNTTTVGIKTFTKREWMTVDKARIYLTICAFMYGSNHVSTKLLQEKLSSPVLTLFRYSIATTFFGKSLVTTKVDAGVIWGSIEIGVWLATGFISQAIALETTTASKVAFFPCLSAVLVPILDMLHDRQLISIATTSITNRNNNSTVNDSSRSKIIMHTKKNNKSQPFIAPFLALLGVAILEFGGLGVKKEDISLILLPIAFATCFHRAGILSIKYPCHTSFIAGMQMVTVAIISLVWTILSGEFPFLQKNRKTVFTAISDFRVFFGLVYSGIFITAWTAYVEQKAIKILSAAETTLMYTMEPLFAAIISSFILGEHLGRNTYLGAICILSACIWSAVGSDITSYFSQIKERNNVRKEATSVCD